MNGPPAETASPDLIGSIPADAWRRVPAALDEKTDVEWCPVVEFKLDKGLGVARTGEWVWGVLTERPRVYPLSGESAVGVLPLLEKPLEEVRAAAALTAQRLNLPAEEILAGLPVEAVLRTALAYQGSDHWVELASAWLEMLPPQVALADELDAAWRDNRLNQRLRHRLRKMARSASVPPPQPVTPQPLCADSHGDEIGNL